MKKKHNTDTLLIIGRNPIKEAINAKRVTRLYLSDSFADQTIMKMIEQNAIPFSRLSVSKLDAMSLKQNHQGIIGECKQYEYSDLNSLIAFSKKANNKPLILILDGIVDPQNFGAIIRSADVFNVTGIIIPKHSQVPLNATVAKISAGAINYVPVCLANNLNQALDTLKKEGFWVVASDGSGTQNYQDINYDFPVALIIGSEGKGISSLLLKNSDYVVKIPQFGHVNSLNASVATGILLSRIRNK